MLVRAAGGGGFGDEPLAGDFQYRQLKFQVLPVDRNHIHDVEAAFRKHSFQLDAAIRRAATTAAG